MAENNEILYKLGQFLHSLFSYIASIPMLNQRSIGDLSQRIGSEVASCHNFGGNIVIDGEGVKNTTRCTLININPGSARSTENQELLKTLKGYQMKERPEKAPTLGFYCEVKNGNLKVGDPVIV